MGTTAGSTTRKSGRRNWFQRHRDRREHSRAAARRDERPFGWSVEVSDWPVGKARTDLSAGAAIRTLKGLGNVYNDAMDSLANATDPELADGADSEHVA